jgi:hypothetical protein
LVVEPPPLDEPPLDPLDEPLLPLEEPPLEPLDDPPLPLDPPPLDEPALPLADDPALDDPLAAGVLAAGAALGVEELSPAAAGLLSPELGASLFSGLVDA